MEEFVSIKDNTMMMKETIINHIRKISDLSCKEFTPSFWTKKPVKVGDGVAIIETYNQDSRLAYCNAVDFLQDIMMVYADKKFMERLIKLNEKEDEEYARFKEANGTQDSWIWTKLELKRKLFGELILLIDRAKLFTASLGVSSEDLEALYEENEERERERIEWEEKNDGN